ncbi:MAG: nucleotidyltransferase domain-containing protein [Sedimenticolaceae bacterium]
MRLSRANAAILKQEVEKVFGREARVWLFGSRVDDTARGGDIDLLVEADVGIDEALDKELRLHARLIRRLGDQRIDIVVHRLGAPLLPIHKSAFRSGVRL